MKVLNIQVYLPWTLLLILLQQQVQNQIRPPFRSLSHGDMKIDIHARKPVLSNIYGGLSGESIKPVGIRYVYEVKKITGKPIIGVGGITTFEDALEYMMAGASAVQIGTAISQNGIGIFNNMSRALKEYMESNSIDDIGEIIGVAIQSTTPSSRRGLVP